MLLKGIVEVLGGGIAQLEGYFCGRLVSVAQVAAGQQQALLGEIAEYGRLKSLLESPLQLVFIQAYRLRDLGKAGRAVDAFVDEVTCGDDLFLISGIFDEDLFFAGGAVTGLGTEDEDLYAFREQEQLLQIAGIAMVDDLIDHLLHGGIDCSPLIGKKDALPIDHPFGKSFQQVIGILGESKECLPRELYPEGLEFEGPVVYGHIEILRIKNIVMTADKVEGLIQLPVLKTIIPLQADMQADHLGIGAAGAETGEGMEPGDGMAHTDAIEFPGKGIAGTFGRNKMLFVLHSRGFGIKDK